MRLCRLLRFAPRSSHGQTRASDRDHSRVCLAVIAELQIIRIGYVREIPLTLHDALDLDELAWVPYRKGPQARVQKCEQSGIDAEAEA